MKTFNETPIQFHTNDGIGLRLANAATRKRLDRGRRGMKPVFPIPSIPTMTLLTGAVSKDILISHEVQQAHAMSLTGCKMGASI